LQAAELVATDEGEALDPVRHALFVDALDLRPLEVVRRDDELAAFSVRHAVALAIGVEPAPPGDAVPGPQGAGRVVHAGVDHLAVARRNAGADACRLLREDHRMA